MNLYRKGAVALPFPVERNISKEMVEAVASGNRDKAVNLFFHHIGWHYFLQKCHLTVDSNLPHRISWNIRLDGSNYRTVGVNRTLDGGTTPILKWKWFYEYLDFELDWLNEKLTIKVRKTILNEILIPLSKGEYRYYKGCFLVKLVTKSKGNYLVEAVDECKAGNKQCGYRIIPKGERFTTVPRLLYIKPRCCRKT
jgi:hypothetical protein